MLQMEVRRGDFRNLDKKSQEHGHKILGSPSGDIKKEEPEKSGRGGWI